MKKILAKLTDDKKEMLLKISICIMAILSIISMLLIGLLDIDQGRNLGIPFIEPCAIVGLVIWILSVLIFVYLTTQIEFIENRSVSKKIEIKAKNYIEFEDKIKEVLISEEYDKEKIIPNNLNCDIKYFVRENRRVVDIFLLVNVRDNLTEEIREQYLEYCYNKIKEDHPNMEKKEINFLHIVCVPKTSDEMRKISERGIEQATKRYQLAVTVSFSNSKVYIAPARNEIWSTKYTILKNRMIKYLDNQINKDVSKEGDA